MRNAFSNEGNRRAARANAFSGPRSLILFAAALLAVAAPALAEHTRWWRQSTFEDFDKGTAKGVALRSDGKMFLAPRFAEFADANLAFLLEIRADAREISMRRAVRTPKCCASTPAASPPRYSNRPNSRPRPSPWMPPGNLFVGTSPDGKVYKVTPAGQSSVFFDPKTKYIWDLAVDKDGTLYVATGDTGKIFVVAPDGKGQVFYSSDETHIRSLALDAAGNLLAGTEPSGRVLRIPKAANNRRAFVLYETSKKEITSLLQDRERRSVRRRGRRKNRAGAGPAATHHHGHNHDFQFRDYDWPRWKRYGRPSAGAAQSFHSASHREFEFRLSNCPGRISRGIVELAR